MTEFEVGSIVEWAGVRGEVIRLDPANEWDRTITVEFEDQKSTHIFFYPGGLVERWHKEPSLKLIERPKQKKLVPHWPAITKFESGAYGLSESGLSLMFDLIVFRVIPWVLIVIGLASLAVVPLAIKSEINICKRYYPTIPLSDCFFMKKVIRPE